MNRPKMILFDYGQTLIKERKFDGAMGTAAVMRYAVANKYGRTPEQIQAQADILNEELGRFSSFNAHTQAEIPFVSFETYLYESQGIKLSISMEEAETIFWDAAAPGQAAEGIISLLKYLKEQGIRTGVVSNISFSGKALRERIDRLLPDNSFEFVIASSDYVFRKPSKRLFQLALEKAGLRAGDVWYVGDQYDRDVAGAASAGLFPVWYTGTANQEGIQDDAVLKIQHWVELEQGLQILKVTDLK